MTAVAVRCSAENGRGQPCKNYVIKVATGCRSHGGAASQVTAKAAIIAEVMHWGFIDKTVDPSDVLLRLVEQSAARAQRHADEFEQLVADSPTLREALIAETWVETEHGSYKAGEYVRGLAQLEAPRARPLRQLRHQGHRRRTKRAHGPSGRAAGPPACRHGHSSPRRSRATGGDGSASQGRDRPADT